MTEHRIVAVETSHARPGNHPVVVAVSTTNGAVDTSKRWTVKAVLDAMNRAERFYSEGSNGRRSRVQRFKCPRCGSEHIRTHISDGAIHDLRNLPQR